jgi:hypothetical protein
MMPGTTYYVRRSGHEDEMECPTHGAARVLAQHCAEHEGGEWLVIRRLHRATFIVDRYGTPLELLP